MLNIFKKKEQVKIEPLTCAEKSRIYEIKNRLKQIKSVDNKSLFYYCKDKNIFKRIYRTIKAYFGNIKEVLELKKELLNLQKRNTEPLSIEEQAELENMKMTSVRLENITFNNILNCRKGENIIKRFIYAMYLYPVSKIRYKSISKQIKLYEKRGVLNGYGLDKQIKLYTEDEMLEMFKNETRTFAELELLRMEACKDKESDMNPTMRNNDIKIIQYVDWLRYTRKDVLLNGRHS